MNDAFPRLRRLEEALAATDATLASQTTRRRCWKTPADEGIEVDDIAAWLLSEVWGPHGNTPRLRFRDPDPDRIVAVLVAARAVQVKDDGDTRAEIAAPEPLLDPDCRDGKCGSCVGGPCEHSCHQPDAEGSDRG